MKNIALLFSMILCLNYLIAGSGPDFDTYFFKKTLRVDFYQTGTKTREFISLDELIEEPIWAGSCTNLVDTLNLGHHFVKVFSDSSGELIYSRGFSSIFAEWRTTSEAANEIFKTFSATVLIPYPKKSIKLVTVKSRKKNGCLL